MPSKPSRPEPILTDSQIAILFETAGLIVPDDLRDAVWAEVRDLKSAANLLDAASSGIPAGRLGAG